MNALPRQLRTHPHFVVCTLAGLVAGGATAFRHGAIVSGLIGWNAGVWIYLVWTLWTMMHKGAEHLERIARAQAEGASIVLTLVAGGALASFGAVVLELASAKAAGSHHALLPHVLLTLATVVGSWLMVPTLFSLNYASAYHTTSDPDGGLRFPDEEKDYAPGYSDFLYFSFTIAVASQTSDISVTNPDMRRLVLLQSVLSFVFNTTVLAFSINIAAGLF